MKKKKLDLTFKLEVGLGRQGKEAGRPEGTQ